MFSQIFIFIFYLEETLIIDLVNNSAHLRLVAHY